MNLRSQFVREIDRDDRLDAYGGTGWGSVQSTRSVQTFDVEAARGEIGAKQEVDVTAFERLKSICEHQACQTHFNVSQALTEALCLRQVA